MILFLRGRFFALLLLLLFPCAAFAQGQGEPSQQEGYVQPQGGDGYVQSPLKGYVYDAPSDGYLPEARLKSTDGGTQPTYAPAPTRPSDEINGGRLLLIAYAGFWLIVLAYVVSLASRSRRTSKEVMRLYRRIQELDDRVEDLEKTSAS